MSDAAPACRRARRKIFFKRPYDPALARTMGGGVWERAEAYRALKGARQVCPARRGGAVPPRRLGARGRGYIGPARHGREGREPLAGPPGPIGLRRGHDLSPLTESRKARGLVVFLVLLSEII